MFTSYVAHEREARTRCSSIRGAVAIRRGFEEEAAHRLGHAEQRFVSRISLLAPRACCRKQRRAGERLMFVVMRPTRG